MEAFPWTFGLQCVSVRIYIYIYIYICANIYICIYIYTYLVVAKTSNGEELNSEYLVAIE